MKHSTLSFFKTGLASLFLLTTIQGCSQASVGFQSDATSVPNVANNTGGGGNVVVPPVVPPVIPPVVNVCNNTALQTISTPVKLLIVVDMSGSNLDDGIYAGSDINKVLRGGSMSRIFADYGGKSNFEWGLIAFQDTQAKALLNSGSQATAVFGNAGAMSAAIDNFKNSMFDGGLTPYKAAITMSSNLIAADNGSADTKYIVVFISDGWPSDYDHDNNYFISAAGAQALNNDITNLVNLKPGRISFNTVYYGKLTQSAGNLMSSMASYGKGQFLDINVNPVASDLLINSVVTVPGAACP